MDLRGAILGLLSWKPLSGYDLKRMISDSEVFYWSGNNNQIYKSLIELQEEGLVTHRLQVQESLPAKKIYSLTPAGLAELRQRLLAEPETPEWHNSFLVQLAWTEELTDGEILALLAAYEAGLTDRLRLLEGRASRPAAAPNRSRREAFIWQRIHANLLSACQNELTWVRQTRQEFESAMNRHWTQTEEEPNDDRTG